MSTPQGTLAQSDEEVLPVGASFGAYEVVRKLGAGSFGVVYEAVRKPLGKRVALKVLRAREVFPAEVLTRFVREAQTAAKLSHPHIVDVFDVGVHAGTPFLAMEYLEGETLAARLEREGALGPRALADVMVPVLSAVAKVHEAGMVHRDLKPENLFLTSPRAGVVHPKLLDFGIVRVAAERESPGLTRTNALLGTPYYMSPEQFQRTREVDARADVWALGVILYECLSGSLPFVGDTLFAVLTRVAAGSPTPLRTLVPSLPPELDAAVSRALSVDPDARFASVRALGRTLLPFASTAVRASWSAEFGVEAPRSTPPPEPPRVEPTRRVRADKSDTLVETLVGAPPDLRDALAPPRPSRAATRVVAPIALAAIAGVALLSLRGSSRDVAPTQLQVRDASPGAPEAADASLAPATDARDASTGASTPLVVDVAAPQAPPDERARARPPRAHPHERDRADPRSPRGVVEPPATVAEPATPPAPQPPPVTRGTAGVPIL